VTRIPLAAISAGVLALLASAVPALFGLVALVFSFSGGPSGIEWFVLALPAGLMCWLLVGAVLLLAGRSWLAVALPAGLVTVLVLWGRVQGSIGGGWHGFALFSAAAPAAATVMACLPGVRRWVSERRRARTVTARPQHPEGR
jgi:hypothetical protein